MSSIAAVEETRSVEVFSLDVVHWDAAQHERSARALERERSLYAHAPALSPRQKALVEKHTAEIEDARVAAATILNSET